MLRIVFQHVHPRPGHPYMGGTLGFVIHDTEDGPALAKLAQKAFDAGVLVIVKDNKINWNGDLIGEW